MRKAEEEKKRRRSKTLELIAIKMATSGIEFTDRSCKLRAMKVRERAETDLRKEAKFLKN